MKPGLNSIAVVCSAPEPKPVAPLLAESRAREPPAIRLSPKKGATIRVVAVSALTEPRPRTFSERQHGRLIAQEAFIAQPLRGRARLGLGNNADGVPPFFRAFTQFRLRHH